MLQIRPDQYLALQAARERESCVGLLSELRAEAPAATAHLKDDEALTLMERAIRRARGHGVESDEAITAYIKLSTFFGLDFDRQSDVARFLRSPDLEPDVTVELLAKATAARMRELGGGGL